MKFTNLLGAESQGSEEMQTQLKPAASETVKANKAQTRKQQLSREEWLNLNSAITSITIYHPLNLKEMDTNKHLNVYWALD